MSINYKSGMLLGCPAYMIQMKYEDIESLLDRIDNMGLSTMCPWYDAEPSEYLVGFPIEGVDSENLNEKWLAEIKIKAARFMGLTGVRPHLLSSMNVT